ncbi:MAG: [LysW]-lysine hydrolase [Trueperaceae bacterium]
MIDPAALLQEVAAIPSPSGEERAVAAHLISRMSEVGGRSFVDDSGSAVCQVGKGPLHVMFLGHIDTVPGKIEVRVEDGRLYGRGTVDAKGPFCAAVAAASRLSGAARAALTVTLIGATEEEASSSRGARYALRSHRRPDLLIIGEPSGWDAITLGYKGRLVVKGTVIKACHHSAGSESSAAEDAIAAWNAVVAWAGELNRGVDGIFDLVQATLQHIESDDDGLEQRCRFTIGLRLPPALPPDAARSGLTAALSGVARVEFAGAEPPYRGPRDTALTRAFRIAIRQHGGVPRFKVKTGTSDMNVVAPHWGVPTVAYGPGDSSLDHTPDEHVEIADLRRAGDVLLSVFERLATLPASDRGLAEPSAS